MYAITNDERIIQHVTEMAGGWKKETLTQELNLEKFYVAMKVGIPQERSQTIKSAEMQTSLRNEMLQEQCKSCPGPGSCSFRPVLKNGEQCASSQRQGARALK